jgi:hypothetical protein
MIFPAPKKTRGRLAKPARRKIKPVNSARRKREFVRCYHSPERVRWVRSLPCAANVLGGCLGAIHNAHTANGGTGRKSGYESIVPLCAKHHMCFDLHRWPFLASPFRDMVKHSAADVALQWELRHKDTPA